jgi:hypothetical protein
MYLPTLAAFVAAAIAAPSLEVRQAAQKVTVDLTKRYQTIDGFGFSAAFQRANLVVNLKEPKQTEVLLSLTLPKEAIVLMLPLLGSQPSLQHFHRRWVLNPPQWHRVLEDQPK